MNLRLHGEAIVDVDAGRAQIAPPASKDRFFFADLRARGGRAWHRLGEDCMVAGRGGAKTSPLLLEKKARRQRVAAMTLRTVSLRTNLRSECHG